MSGALHEWVTQTACRTPDSRAVIGEDEILSYREIDEYSNRLARLLGALGCARGDRVGLFAPNSAIAVGSLIGVLKAGCAYVPFDPAGPVERNADIVRQCAPTLILAGGCSHQAIADLVVHADATAIPIGWIGPGPVPEAASFDRADVERASSAANPMDVGPDDLAYVMFTSGTTGSPKGVPITHGNVSAFIRWAVNYFELGPTDKLSAHTALTFDLSTFDIHAAFAAGAELHQVPKRVRMMPHEVAGFIEERELTVWFSVPSQLAYVARFEGLEGRSLPSIRHIIWCGDVLATPALLHWKRRLPGVTFTNLYGPTETTVASSYYRVPDDFDDPGLAIPIGFACEGEQLLVLDDRLQPVPQGEVGDLYIGGAGLSSGYWGDPVRTAAAFVERVGSSPSPVRLYRTGDLGRIGPDGVAHFLGRADFQIKKSGYRVEPEEVENALLALPEVAACVVVAVAADDFTGSAIGCAYVLSNGEPLHPRELKKRLARTLPDYMVPTRWQALDDLPVDSRGKTDRVRARAILEASRDGGGPPTTLLTMHERA